MRFKRAQEHRKRSPDENLVAFSVLEILPVLLEIRSTPSMCGISSIFVTLNISTFCSKALVVTFPTQLDSPDLEFIRESYCISGFAVSLLSGRSLRSSGPESPVLGFSRECFSCSAPGGGRSFRPKGPEYPPQAGVSGPRGRSLCLCFSRLEMVHPLVGAGVSAPTRG